MTQNVVVNFIPEGVEPTIQATDEVTDSQKQLNDEIKARQKLLADAGGILSEYTAKLQAAQKAAVGAFGVKQLKDFETQAIKSFKALVSGVKAGSKSVEVFDQEIKLHLLQSLTDAGVSVVEFAGSLKDAGSSMDDFVNTIKLGVMDEFADKFKQAVPPVKTLKSELKLLKDQLALMEQQGKEDTKEFMNMAIAAGRLEDQIGDTAERVRVLASDTANLDAGIEGIQMLANAAQLGAGATALFGGSEEDLQKVLVKLNAIMAITTALTEMKKFVTGQSALAIKAETLATNLNTVAQRIYAVAVGQSTGMMKAFRLILLTSGIGAIVLLLGWLATKMNLFGESTDEATERIKKQKEHAAELVEELEKVAAAEEKIRNARAGGLDSLNRELTLLKAKGATDKEVFEAEQKIRQKELFNLQVRLSTFTGTKEKEAELTKEIEDKKTEILAGSYAYEKGIRDKNLKDSEDAAAKQIALNEKVAAEKKRLDKLELDSRNEIVKIGLESQATAEKDLAQNETLSFAVRKQAAENYIVIQTKLIENQAKIDKAAAETAGQRALAETKRIQELAQINEEGAKIMGQIWIDYNKKIIDLTKAPDVEEATQEQIDKQFKMIFDGLDAQEKELDKAHKKQLDKMNTYISGMADFINKTFGDTAAGKIIATAVNLRTTLQGISEAQRNGEITAEEAHQQRKKAIITAGIAATQEVVNNIFAAGAEKRQAELDKQIENLNTAKDQELQSKNLTEQQKDDINKKYAAKERQLKLKAFEEDKKAKRNQAIINGLLGITNALATAPTIIAGVILAAIVAATTALSVAKIASTQPGFKKGGYTGDGSPDDVAGFVHRKEFVAHAEATKRYKPALEAINRLKFDEYLAKISPVPKSMTPLPEWAGPGSGSGFIDYDKLGRSVAAHTNAPSMIMNFDEDGASAFLIEKNRQVMIKNKRYKV